MSRPSLLFLSHCLPHPPHMGVLVRTSNIVDQLARGFDVTMLAFSRSGHQPDQGARNDAADALRRRGVDVRAAAPIPSERSRALLLWTHLMSVARQRPYTYWQYRHPDLARALAETLASRRFDIVHLDALDLHGWIDLLPPDVPVVCTHHDIESHALTLRAGLLRGPVASYVRWQAELVKRLEHEQCPRFAANLVMSDVDGSRLGHVAPRARILVAPNGVDLGLHHPTPPDAQVPGRVLFVGPTYHLPNRDALHFFLDDVWPRVRAMHPGATFRSLGRSPEAHRAFVDAQPEARALGLVPDVRPHVAEASCIVVPLRAGGGTRIKILEAWALGKAVVTTRIGCEGLDARHGENALIADDPAEFAAEVTRVLADPALRHRLGAAGRRTVEERYGWDGIGATLRERYLEIAGRSAPAPASVATRRTADVS